jgi:quinol monooxygenase YgiN
MYIILVPIQIKQEHREAYIQAATEATSNSVNKERGFLRCDLIQDADDPNRVWYYEVFTDEAAHKAQLQTQLVKKFTETTKDWQEEEQPQGAGIGSYNIWPADGDWK